MIMIRPSPAMRKACAGVMISCVMALFALAVRTTASKTMTVVPGIAIPGTSRE